MAKTPEELYTERVKRVEDAIQLKVPDRIPLVPHPGFFPLKYAGITVQEAMYDYNKTYIAWEKRFPTLGGMGIIPHFFFQGTCLNTLTTEHLGGPGTELNPLSHTSSLNLAR